MIISNIEKFTNLVLTQSKLEQGARSIQGEHKHENKLSCLWCSTNKIKFDLKKIYQFIKWIENHFKNEISDDLISYNLTWEQVRKAIISKARSWYLEKVKYD